MDDFRIYNRALSSGEIKDLYTSTTQWQTGDCLDSNGAMHPLTRWYKDTDNDGYSDGTRVQQCAQPAGYNRPVNLIATGGDCNDTNDLLTPNTIRYLDADADGFSQ